MSRRSIPALLGEEVGFPGIQPLPTVTFMISLGTVMAHESVPSSLLMCYNECMRRLKV